VKVSSFFDIAEVDYRQEDLFDIVGNNSVDMVVNTLGFPGTADKSLRELRSGVVYVVLPGTNGCTLSPNIKAGVNFGPVQPNTVNLMVLTSYFDARTVLTRACKASTLSILPWHSRKSPAGTC